MNVGLCTCMSGMCLCMYVCVHVFAGAGACMRCVECEVFYGCTCTSADVLHCTHPRVRMHLLMIPSTSACVRAFVCVSLPVCVRCVGLCLLCGVSPPLRSLPTLYSIRLRSSSCCWLAFSVCCLCRAAAAVQQQFDSTTTVVHACTIMHAFTIMHACMHALMFHHEVNGSIVPVIGGGCSVDSG